MQSEDTDNPGSDQPCEVDIMSMTPPEEYWKAANCANLHLLKSHITITPPTDKEPYYKVSMTKKKANCTISIAVTKPIPDPLLTASSPLGNDGLKTDAHQWVTVDHSEDDCLCAWYSHIPSNFFVVWQTLHNRLRRMSTDHAAFAFYPEHEYELGEALGHAALVLNLAMNGVIPCCYIHLIDKLGGEMLALVVGRRMEKDNMIDSAPIDAFDLDAEQWFRHSLD